MKRNDLNFTQRVGSSVGGIWKGILAAAAFAALFGCVVANGEKTSKAGETGLSGKIMVEQPYKQFQKIIPEDLISIDQKSGRRSVILGGGCFWCVEAVMQRLEGVKAVSSGYSGGHVEKPTYEAVCGKKTGHIEVVLVSFDPEKITLARLLEVFFTTHDPTTKDRQGNDVGPQYRSVIFSPYPEDVAFAAAMKEKLNAAALYPSPIVTEVAPLISYFNAEDYHQNYYNENPGQGYCSFVIAPKLEKFRKAYADLLKK